MKKNQNIHGIIFGAKHPRAVEKFLDVAWGKNKINGEANFDIDDDQGKSQLTMFEEQKLTKIESFQQALEEKVKASGTITNADLYLFTLEKGHPKSHATACLKALKRGKRIDYLGLSPKIAYTALTKREDLVQIKWIK
ncbi:MAG: hypothetical protein EOP51_04440 [Sphingobacteriales bacterium]|nr:MAG: hypothetical protein EOP51_04440 [Sphingobacteriales bacterium]